VVIATVEQNAQQQVVFREVNEQIARLTNEVGVSVLICECSDVTCAESLEIARTEYDRVRSHSDHFVVAPGHQLDEIETVIGGNGRFLVVEKIGAAATIAQASDSRRHG
jgi:hypothetical protein